MQISLNKFTLLKYVYFDKELKQNNKLNFYQKYNLTFV